MLHAGDSENKSSSEKHIRSVVRSMVSSFGGGGRVGGRSVAFRGGNCFPSFTFLCVFVGVEN